MKISLFQARIIRALSDMPQPARNSAQLAKELESHIQYIYQETRQLRLMGLLEEVPRGRKKFFEPTTKGVEFSTNRIDEEIAKKTKLFKKHSEVDENGKSADKTWMCCLW